MNGNLRFEGDDSIKFQLIDPDVVSDPSEALHELEIIADEYISSYPEVVIDIMSDETDIHFTLVAQKRGPVTSRLLHDKRLQIIDAAMAPDLQTCILDCELRREDTQPSAFDVLGD